MPRVRLCLKTAFIMLTCFISFTPGFSQVTRHSETGRKPYKRFPASAVSLSHKAEAGCEMRPGLHFWLMLHRGRVQIPSLSLRVLIRKDLESISAAGLNSRVDLNG